MCRDGGFWAVAWTALVLGEEVLGPRDRRRLDDATLPRLSGEAESLSTFCGDRWWAFKGGRLNQSCLKKREIESTCVFET